MKDAASRWVSERRRNQRSAQERSARPSTNAAAIRPMMNSNGKLHMRVLGTQFFRTRKRFLLTEAPSPRKSIANFFNLDQEG